MTELEYVAVLLMGQPPLCFFLLPAVLFVQLRRLPSLGYTGAEWHSASGAQKNPKKYA